MFYTGIAAFAIVTLFRYFAKQKHRWKGSPKFTPDGQEYLVRHKPRTKNSPERFWLGIPADCKTSFMIFREKNSNLYLKKIGLCNEFQTGDDEFDKRYFISCDETAFLSELQKNETLRKLIDDLFAKGADYLICANNKIWFECNSKIQDEMHQPYVDILKEISAGVGNTNRSLKETFFDRNNIIASIFMAVHSAALLFGFFSIIILISAEYALPDKQRWITLSVPFALLLLSIWLAVIMAALKNSSRLNLVLTDYVISGIAGFVLLSFVTVYEYNKDFDHNPKDIKFLTVYDKYTYKCGKRNRSTCYSIVLEDWKEPGRSRKIKVSSSEYYSANPGSRMQVVIGSGALGISYVDSLGN